MEYPNPKRCLKRAFASDDDEESRLSDRLYIDEGNENDNSGNTININNNNNLVSFDEEDSDDDGDESCVPGKKSRKNQERKVPLSEDDAERKRVLANSQERDRMNKLNRALCNLRHALPADFSVCNRRLSKIRTLRLASRYIRNLRHMLDADDAARSTQGVGYPGYAPAFQQQQQQQQQPPFYPGYTCPPQGLPDAASFPPQHHVVMTSPAFLPSPHFLQQQSGDRNRNHSAGDDGYFSSSFNNDSLHNRLDGSFLGPSQRLDGSFLGSSSSSHGRPDVTSASHCQSASYPVTPNHPCFYPTSFPAHLSALSGSVDEGYVPGSSPMLGNTQTSFLSPPTVAGNATSFQTSTPEGSFKTLPTHMNAYSGSIDEGFVPSSSPSFLSGPGNTSTLGHTPSFLSSTPDGASTFSPCVPSWMSSTPVAGSGFLPGGRLVTSSSSPCGDNAEEDADRFRVTCLESATSVGRGGGGGTEEGAPRYEAGQSHKQQQQQHLGGGGFGSPCLFSSTPVVSQPGLPSSSSAASSSRCHQGQGRGWSP